MDSQTETDLACRICGQGEAQFAEFAESDEWWWELGDSEKGPLCSVCARLRELFREIAEATGGTFPEGV